MPAWLAPNIARGCQLPKILSLWHQAKIPHGQCAYPFKGMGTSQITSFVSDICLMLTNERAAIVRDRQLSSCGESIGWKANYSGERYRESLCRIQCCPPSQIL